MLHTHKASAIEGRPAGELRRFGAVIEGAGAWFRVPAPRTRDLQLRLLSGEAAGIHRPLRSDGGVHEFFVRGAGAGDRYLFTLDGSDPRPDPASRFQPEGVHGPSQIVDPDAYRWTHVEWAGRDPRELAIYELHVGTFAGDGTFRSVRERLPELRDLGVTAIELMPVADFPGSRNWGYDGACLFAPARAYGTPDELRALVDAAHGYGLSVILDAVYNHLGPEGAYLHQFYPDYITTRHMTPWGGAVNLDAPGSDLVRAFIVDNAVHWIREYRIDGLRLDATHALIDTSATHLVAELVDAVRAAARWPVVIFGEDHRNLATLVEPTARGGWGLDGLWADDFHHVVRRRTAGDRQGYYEDYEGSCEELAATIRQGWLFTGQHSRHLNGPRGSDASRVPMRKFVVCLQNHDQIGNRARGERLHHQIDDAAWRAASVVLLTSPMTPLLFMGQEWAASTPFQFFTDLEPALGRLVTEGRRHEFRCFSEFADPAARECIPDPQAESTFEASRLKWEERAEGVHAATLALYTDLLRLRHTHEALANSPDLAGDAEALDADTLIVRRHDGSQRFWIVASFSPAPAPVTFAVEGAPRMVLTSEDVPYTIDPLPPEVEIRPGSASVRFRRAGALILTVA